MLRAPKAEPREARPSRPRGLFRPDLLFSSSLKQALRQAGCPLCRLLCEADRHYITVFLREGKDDGRMLLRLLGSWGLCPRHANALVQLEPAERGDGLGTGTLYDWLLDYARRRLEDFRQSLAAHDDPGTARRRRISRRTIDRALARLRQTGRCPACEAQLQHAAYVVQEFVRAMEPTAGLPEIREMYLASGGLCLPHWRAVQALRASPDVREHIARKQREVAASLKAALNAALTRGVLDEGVGDGPGKDPAYASALAAVAGETGWKPSRR